MADGNGVPREGMLLDKLYGKLRGLLEHGSHQSDDVADQQPQRFSPSTELAARAAAARADPTD